MCLSCLFNRSFIKQIFTTFEKTDNYCILLSALTSKYSDIYNKSSSIKEILNNTIDNGERRNVIYIYNNLVFTSHLLVKDFISKPLFKELFLDLDRFAIEYYSYNILFSYMSYEDELVYYIAENGSINICDRLVDLFIKMKYGEITKLLNIVEHTISNRNMNIYMFGELLTLLKLNPQNVKLREICSSVSKVKCSFLDWKKLQGPLLELMKTDEDYLIEKIFIPMSEEYFRTNTFYVEKKYLEIFDGLYKYVKKDYNREKMKKMANKAFKKGLTALKVYK